MKILPTLPKRPFRWLVNARIAICFALPLFTASGVAQVHGGSGHGQVPVAGVDSVRDADGRLEEVLSSARFVTPLHHLLTNTGAAAKMRAVGGHGLRTTRPVVALRGDGASAAEPQRMPAYLKATVSEARAAAGVQSSTDLIVRGPFQGTAYNGFYPPDPTIAAGPLNVVVAVNGTLNVLGRDGTILGSQSLQHFFSPLGSVASDGAGPVGPHAIYDQYINRFWLVVFTRDDGAPRSTILLGISDTSDAASSWTIYSFDGGQDGGTASGFLCDSPQIGVDAQAVYISSNQFDSSGNFQYARIRVMAKDQFVKRPLRCIGGTITD